MSVFEYKNKKRSALSAMRIILLAILIAFLLKLFVVDLFIVDGSSMSPTIEDASLVFVLRCAYGLRIGNKYIVKWAEPKPGEIVLAELGNRKAIKRVFEVGPAYIYSAENTINGRGGKRQGGNRILFSGTNFISSGRVFLLGDNDSESLDSRYYGTVSTESIIGRVILY